MFRGKPQDPGAATGGAAVAPPPTAQLTPREVAVLDCTASTARIKCSLPVFSTSSGDPVDVRVLIRPARLWRDFRAANAADESEIRRLGMKYNQENARRMAEQASKPATNEQDKSRQAMERMRFFQEHTESLRVHQTAISERSAAFARKCRALLPPPAGFYASPDEEAKFPSAEWFACAAGSAGFIPLTRDDWSNADQGTTVRGAAETFTITLSSLASNTYFEVVVQARRRGAAAPSGTADDPVWSSLSDPAKSFFTPPALWQTNLEGAGLRTLIDVFNENGLSNMESWLDLLARPDRLLELNIDPTAEAQLRAILSREGVVTPEERAQLDKDREELTAVVARLVQEQGAAPAKDHAKFQVGDAVVDRKTGKRFGVVAEVSGGADGPLGVRWLVGTHDPANAPISRGVPAKDLSAGKFDFFMSHAQMDAQNQVAHLSVLLREAGATAWVDMDSERLEARDMVRGVANSGTFLLYLTRNYLNRYFCRLEFSVAKAMKKDVVVVFEPDERHGGAGDYVALVNQVTKKYPEFKDALLGVEAIPMARRAFQRRTVVEEVMKRAGVQPTQGGGAAAGGSMSRSGSITALVGLGGGGGGAGKDAAEELRRLIVDMQMELNDLKAENQELWAAVRAGAAQAQQRGPEQ